MFGKILYRFVLWSLACGTVVLAGAGDGERIRRIQLLPVSVERPASPLLSVDLDRV